MIKIKFVLLIFQILLLAIQIIFKKHELMPLIVILGLMVVLIK